MNTELLTQALDSIITDDKVKGDLYKILSDGRDGGVTLIELNEVWVSVPIDVPLFIITKMFYSRRYDIGFGTYRILVSLGEPVKNKSGGVDPTYCFSTLYYNENLEMFTLDFHTQLYR